MLSRPSVPSVSLRRFPPGPRESRDALTVGPISIQDIDPLPLALRRRNCYYSPNPLVSEDCLNLNVWSPGLADRAAVLVWIDGGAFLCGSGGGPWLDGTRQARRTASWLVTLNYRLGYLGGLFLGDYDVRRSNLGLQDRILALRWVRDNIAAFGGDPDELRSAAIRPAQWRQRP